MILNDSTSFTLKLHETIEFEKGIFLRLTDFSHKRSVADESKATAYLTVIKNGQSQDITLSTQKTGGVLTYESCTWLNYQLELKGMDYGESIELKVIKSEQ